MTQTQHTAGARRATNHINEYFDWMELSEHQKGEMDAIIDEETHAAEMEAFIEKVTTLPINEHWTTLRDALIAVKREALELIEKVSVL